MNQKHDVIIIGGGAAGLMAALELCTNGKNILVLEAAPQPGGRIISLKNPLNDHVVELGAEFIHGDLQLTKKLCDAAGIKYKETGGEFWRKEGLQFIKKSGQIEKESKLEKAFEKLTTDIPIQIFLDQYFADDDEAQQSIKSYIEGYYAGDLNKASTLFFKEEWQKSDEVQYRITGGYGALIGYLSNELRKRGGVIQTNTVVTEITYNNNGVSVYAGTEEYSSENVIITASVGVMQNRTIQFNPQITAIETAYQQLGFGDVIKLVLQFKDAFWLNKEHTGADLKRMAFLFTEEEVPTWWTMHPQKSKQLTGWITAAAATQKKALKDEALITLGLQSLANIFSMSMKDVAEKCLSAEVKNWCADANILGGYAYETVQAKEARDIIIKGVGNRIFFAGEGLYNGINLGTVEAALHTGKAAAKKIMSFQVV